MSEKTCLYEDSTVKICPDEIQILQYYYPLPMNKTINMCDVKEVNLKTDVNKHQKYIEVIVKGLSMNATFSPKDPQKCLDIIRSHSCFELAGKNIQQASTALKTNVKAGFEDIKSKAQQKKEDIKQGAKQMKYGAQKKWEEGKQQVKEVVNKQPGIIENVTATISKGWQEVKQVSHEIYEAATQKIHEMTAPSVEQKAHQAKQDIKQGARDIKQGVKDVGKDVERKYEQGKWEAKKATGMEPQKTVYENVKETTVQGWQNLKEGAENVYHKAAQKVSEIVGTDAESKAKKAKEEFKQGAKEAKQSIKKATLPEKSVTEQAKEKVQQWTGTDAKGKAQDAKQHFKQGAEDAKQSAKKATGYEGSKLQQAKQNIAEGWQNTKKSAQSAYDTAAKKLSDAGSSIQETVGQKTKQAGQALKEKGNKMQKNA